MGRKAGSKILKRSMAPNFWSLAKKQKRFVIRPHSGPHNLKSSMPLTVLLRDILNLTKTYNESKYVINEGNIQVDGKIRRDTHFPVGLMDVIEIGKINQIYRLVPSNNLLSPLLISPEEKNMKLCKVIGKKSLNQNTYQYSLHDGRTLLLSSETNISVGSTLKLEIPSQKVLKVLELKKDNLVALIGGQNKGNFGKIINIKSSSISRPQILEIEVNTNLIEAPSRITMVVGKNKPELHLYGD